MELQINDLVSAIKKDGIEAANNEAAQILDEATKKAETIVAEAKSEAARIKAASEKDIKLFEESAKINAEQAERDAVLAFKAQVQSEFEKLLSADISKKLDEKSLAQLILAAINGEELSKYAVELQNVSDGLKTELAEEIKNGLELRVSKNVKGGFKLSAKDGSGYFDCTDDEIKNMLMPFFRNIRL